MESLNFFIEPQVSDPWGMRTGPALVISELDETHLWAPLDGSVAGIS